MIYETLNSPTSVQYDDDEIMTQYKKYYLVQITQKKHYLVLIKNDMRFDEPNNSICFVPQSHVYYYVLSFP